MFLHPELLIYPFIWTIRYDVTQKFYLLIFALTYLSWNAGRNISEINLIFFILVKSQQFGVYL